MDQADFVGWVIILMGCLVSCAGLAKGAMALFAKKLDDDGSSRAIDGGGIILAIILLLAGIWLMSQGSDFPAE